MKKMTLNKLRDFIFENYYKRIEFVKESSYYSIKCLKGNDFLLLATKLIEKIADRSNAKQYYSFYLKKKNKKLVTRSKIITQHPKTFENLNIVYVKLVTIKPQKTYHKLSKAIEQTERVSQVGSGKISNSPLYSETKKVKNV